ncbi:hypothetical protein [Mollivirus kamchatka]|nr:hypothetical protein [Mollivirus kamchatka]
MLDILPLEVVGHIVRLCDLVAVQQLAAVSTWLRHSLCFSFRPAPGRIDASLAPDLRWKFLTQAGCGCECEGDIRIPPPASLCGHALWTRFSLACSVVAWMRANPLSTATTKMSTAVGPVFRMVLAAGASCLLDTLLQRLSLWLDLASLLGLCDPVSDCKPLECVWPLCADVIALRVLATRVHTNSASNKSRRFNHVNKTTLAVERLMAKVLILSKTESDDLTHAARFAAVTTNCSCHRVCIQNSIDLATASSRFGSSLNSHQFASVVLLNHAHAIDAPAAFVRLVEFAIRHDPCFKDDVLRTRVDRCVLRWIMRRSRQIQAPLVPINNTLAKVLDNMVSPNVANTLLMHRNRESI